MDYDRFRNNIKIKRTILGITAKQLAVKANMKQLKRISDIEEGRGKPNLEEVVSICEVLDENVDNMLFKNIKVKINWE